MFREISMNPQKYKFSDELMQRGKKYFDKLCGREVSFEEIELWLDSLADFISCFDKSSDKIGNK